MSESLSTDHFNQLTPAEVERLAVLAEEAGEVVQIVGKILRHGYESRNPLEPKRGTNREMLEREVGDFYVALHMLFEHGDIRRGAVAYRESIKQDSLPQYLHHTKLRP